LERFLVRKAVAINDEKRKIRTLESLVAHARAQVKEILHTTHFRLLPTITYDPQFHSYIFLVEYPSKMGHPESFEETMMKLKRIR
jgi:hypothetical protein